MEINELTGKIIGAAIEVHKTLGPGLLEKCYEAALVYELTQQGIKAVSQVPVPLIYKGVDLFANKEDKDAFRIDILVEDTVIIELKSVEEIKNVHHKQVLTYLKLTGKHYGLLINFNVNRLLDGVSRKIN